MSVEDASADAATRRGQIARFDSFSLDLDVGELRHEGELVPLRPKAVDVLVLLVRQAGRLVPRDRLVQGVWGDTHVDADAALHSAIREVRRALGDDASEPAYVDTVHRRGYRFVADVELAPMPETAGAPAAAQPRRWIVWAAVAAALALCALLVVLPRAADEASDDAAPPAPEAAPELTASRAVLRGRYLVNHGSHEELDAGVALLREAVAAPGAGALAWSGLAIGELRLARYRQAWLAAGRALRIESRSPEALRVMGQLAVVLGEDLSMAESLLLRSLELDPSSGKAQHAYGVLLAASGRLGEAIRMAETGRALAPGAFVIRANLARYRLYDHDFVGAADEARAVLVQVPDHVPTLETLQVALWFQGDLAGARDAAVRLASALGAPASLTTGLRRAPPETGFRDALRWRLRYLEGQAGADRHVWAALLRAQLDDPDGAVAELERVGDRVSSLLPVSLRDPRLDPVRDHPVMRRLAARYRMPAEY